MIYRYIRIITILLITVLIQYCSSVSESIYTFNYPLTADKAFSQSSGLIVSIPEGWFTAEDNDCKCIDLWLIRDDFSATMNLIAINMDELTEQDIKGHELESVVRFSKALKKAELWEKFKESDQDEYFEIGKRQYSAYQYIGDEGLPIRIVIFKYGDKFFEFSAVPTQKVGEGKVIPENLFTIQNSVLASIK